MEVEESEGEDTNVEVVREFQEQDSKYKKKQLLESSMRCLFCAQESILKSFSKLNLTELKLIKELIAEITFSDASCLSQNNGINICLSCRHTIEEFRFALDEFINIRAKLCNLSIAICDLLKHTYASNSFISTPKDKSEQLAQFNGWNIERLQKILTGYLDSEKLLRGEQNYKLNVNVYAESNIEDVRAGEIVLEENIASVDNLLCRCLDLRERENNSNPQDEHIAVRSPIGFQNKCLDCKATPFNEIHTLKIDTSPPDYAATYLCTEDILPKSSHVVLRKTNEEKQIFKCPICQQKFRQKRSLDIHMYNKHIKSGIQGKNICQLCQKTFNTPVLLMTHFNLHQDEFECKNSLCKKSFRTKEILEDHEKVHELNSQVFDCDFCTLLFNNSDQRVVHVNSHFLVSDTCLCEQCGKSFPSKSILCDHVKRDHSQSESGFNCHVCQKNFHSYSNFRAHERIHTGEKPFQCDYCNFCASQSSSLKLHLRKHSGVMPYQCDYCDHPGYSYKKALRRHLAEAHTRLYLRQKKFLCQVCWENFESEIELSKHNVFHSKYICKICKRQFKMLIHLKEHLLRHAGVKPFKCGFCETASFLRQKGLLNHIGRIHPNEDATDALVSKQTIIVEFGQE